MSADELLETLRALETTLHRPELLDRSRLHALLHDEFVEFGRSGNRYDKAEIMAALSSAGSPPARVWSQDFAVARVADGVALLTYKSAHVDADGKLSRHTLRSSVWQCGERGWTLRFHQGTPTEAFARPVV